MRYGFSPCLVAGMSCPPLLLDLLSLLVAGDFASDLLPATMEDKTAKPPGSASKGDPPSLPSLPEAPPAVKAPPPVHEGHAWLRPPPSHIPPPPIRQRKPKSS